VVELRTGDEVAEALVVEHDSARCLEQRGNGACVALDPATRLCTIYESRPRTCREFERGDPLCRRILGCPAATPPLAG
jgi:Fe-S-cluster containining protein